MLSKDDVKKIARLARLGLTDAEVGKFAGQLSAILDHAKALSEVNTDGVEPIAQITGLSGVAFADEARPCEDADALLAASPQPVTGRMIQVNNVFE